MLCMQDGSVMGNIHITLLCHLSWSQGDFFSWAIVRNITLSTLPRHKNKIKNVPKQKGIFLVIMTKNLTCYPFHSCSGEQMPNLWTTTALIFEKWKDIRNGRRRQRSCSWHPASRHSIDDSGSSTKTENSVLPCVLLPVGSGSIIFGW